MTSRKQPPRRRRRPSARSSEAMHFEESSGNVFADLGLPNPEERLAKAHLRWRSVGSSSSGG